MSAAEALIRSEVDSTREMVVDIRRQLHRHPELSFLEHATAQLAAERAGALGFTVRTGVGGTGVVADLDSGRPGKTLMLRADMDALPIEERGSGGPVRSEVSGAMHACGHDGHVAMTLGAAAALVGLRDHWSGSLRLCFQPAEEVAGGALPMIRDGAVDSVDQVLGIHLWSLLDAGRVAVTAGPIFGSADEFRLTIRGRGGHGGMPHLSVDPIVAAASVVTALQTLVSRETSPFQPAVVTVGQISGGSAFNVIAEETFVRGTVRALDEDVRERLLRRVGEVAQHVARAHGAEASMERCAGTPPVVSDGATAGTVRRAAAAVVGEDHVDTAQPITVGDDVAYFLQRAPGCYFLVGAGDPTREHVAPHHHPEFDIDERCLPIGVETLVRGALEILGA